MKYAQRTLAECTQIFCARGVPDFRKFCKFFARFLRKICVISTLDSRFILHQNAHRLGQELQRSSALRATTLAEFTQLLRARRAEKFRGLCNSFARVGRKFCVIPTRDAFLFESECNTDSINSQRRCEVCAAHAGRVHAIFARGACRISGNFANFSRAFRAKFASSRRWIRALSCIRTHADSEKELQRRSAVRATTLAEFTQLLCARRAEIFRKLRNFFRASSAQKLRDPDAGRVLFRI